MTHEGELSRREETELVEVYRAFSKEATSDSARSLVTAAADILGWKTERRLPRIQAFLWEIGLLFRKEQCLLQETFMAYALSLNFGGSIPTTLRPDLLTSQSTGEQHGK